MTLNRKPKFIKRRENILHMAELLLLEKNQDITLDELANQLNTVKGTIYRYFKSKNELYLELLILNETRIFDLAKKYNNDINKNIYEYMLYNMLNPNRTILLHIIEENLTNNESNFNTLFQQLYNIREKRIFEIKEIFSTHLKQSNSDISIRDYLSYIWSITYGACLLLNSTYYQKSIGSRSRLIELYIHQALTTPQTNQEKVKLP